MITYIIKQPNKEEPFLYRNEKMEFRYLVTAREFYRKLRKLYPELDLKLIREETPDYFLIKRKRNSREIIPK